MFASITVFSRRAFTAVAVALLVTLAGAAYAGKVYTTGRDGVAIGGTDPVAYFTDGRAVAGSREFTAEWNGAKWRFANAANLATFKAAPEKYAPQYGGFCAWAVSQGYTASIDPEAWKIVDGKLYLNYSKGVQNHWAGDIPGNIAKADGNWPGIRAGL